MIRREPENLVGSDNSFVFLHAVFFFAPEVLARRGQVSSLFGLHQIIPFFHHFFMEHGL